MTTHKQPSVFDTGEYPLNKERLTSDLLGEPPDGVRAPAVASTSLDALRISIRASDLLSIRD